MRNSASYELLGAIAYAYIVPISPTLSRTSGLVKGDFAIALYNPAGSDIAGSTSITVTEFGSTGAYAFAVSLPSSGEGNYTLSVTDPDGQVHSCVFMAYATLQGDTGDGTAQLELWIFAPNGSPISGRVIGDLTSRIYDPTMTPYAGATAPTLTELAPGHYMYGFDDTASVPGNWFFDILDPTYFPLGKQGTWLYLSATVEVAEAPELTAAVNDGTGTSATMSFVAQNPADTIYTYYRLLPYDVWTLSVDTRVGSGDVQITGLTNNRKYEFIGVASRSGSPIINQSPPSVTRRVYVWDQVTLFDTIRDALWDWVDSETPATVIWIPSNAPMPAPPFVTLLMRPVEDIHRDYHTEPDASGIATIYADREFLFEVQVYGEKHPDGSDLAQTYVENIKASLQTRAVLDALNLVGLAPRESLATQDLSAIGRTEFEARYMFETRFGMTYEHTDDVGVINTSDAPTGAYS